MLLLLVYLTGSAPLFLFHSHGHIVSISEADSCEKAVYYGIKDSHSSHLTKTVDSCQLCDNHTAAPQLLFTTEFIGFLPVFESVHYLFLQRIHTIGIRSTADRGPPAV